MDFDIKNSVINRLENFFFHLSKGENMEIINHHVTKLSMILISLFFAVLACKDQKKLPPPIAESAAEPLIYTGEVQTDKQFYDGAVRHAVGVHHSQVFRANRSFPSEGGEIGWTYNHQPYLAYWNGKFYLQFLSGLLEEHSPSTRILLLTSRDGRVWSDPAVAFPEYELPEIKTEDGYLPAGTKSVMHQRMGFYAAPNGRLLISGFYSYCFNPRHSPNRGHGLGRVVREIYRDGSMGPIFFIRYNRHAGFDESNTTYPFYQESDDSGFKDACESLLANKLITLQWWEEDRGEDGFYRIDPSAVEDPARKLGGVTTSAGAGKAFCFFHRPDGVVVGIWKNQWSGLSSDEGETWTPLVRNKSLMTCGAKVWGQRTDDGEYAIVYNHSATRRNRFPLVVMTSPDGHEFQKMYCLQGEVPPKRYQGIHKNPGPQYVRGIIEGNGNPPGDFLWNVYSMNKEDIWVTRTQVPILGVVSENVDENFDDCRTEADLTYWNLYMPMWSAVAIVPESGEKNKYLELLDEEPYDYALVERAFPVSRIVEVDFRVNIQQVAPGNALEIEVQDQKGSRPMRLRLDGRWLGLDRAQVFPLQPLKIETGKWYHIAMKLNCDSQSYDLSMDGVKVRKNISFATKMDSLERVVFRTGPYRGDVRQTVLEKGEPKPAGLYSEDLPGSEVKIPRSRYWIDDLKITKVTL